MTFGEFARVLETIEKTTLRNEMMVLLAQLLSQAKSDEVAQMVYLALGGLRPKFDRLEFNLAEKMVMRAVARSVGVSVDEVLGEYKKVGDLGSVAETLCISQSVDRSPSLSVGGVYAWLERIAREEGQGSQERKVEGLANLFGNLDSLSVRYVTRMVVGKLRLGFSDKTILDALSFMEKGNKEARNDLDWAYQVSPDIGTIARLVKEHGAAKVASMVTVQFGVPVVPALAQRLKTAKEMIEKMGRVGLEPKYDGTRVQIHFRKIPRLPGSSHLARRALDDKANLDSLFALSSQETNQHEVRTFTRNLDENSEMFPELEKIDEQLAVDEVILDSEAVGYDKQTGALLPFQMTITRKRKHGIGVARESVPLKFFVFDILYLNGKSLIGLPLSERRKILASVVKKGEVLEVDTLVETDDPAIVREYHQQQLDAGLEGAMVKQIDGVYSPGRTGFNWVKFKEVEEAEGKLSDTIDGVVMGYYRGRGKRAGFGVGAFLVGVMGDEGSVLTLAKIGTGLSDEQWRELKERCGQFEVVDKPKEYGEVEKMLVPDVWVNPGIVVEVAADEITKSPMHSAGVALRFPRLVKFRDDKSVSEITTVEELARIG